MKCRRLQTRPAARHGRIEPVPRSHADDLRQASPDFPSCTCSIPPTRRRSAPSRRKSIWRTRSSSSPANPAARSSRTSSNNISSSASGGRPSGRFIAITDPGSKMQQVAESDQFRHIFFGLPSIGGRYSALSDFGMVPAAVMGVDVPHFLELTAEMVHACAATVPAEENPGVHAGRDPGRARQPGPRQGHDHRLARHSRSRRVARAVARRIHRQDRQGPDSGRPRSARQPRGLRQ